MSSLLSINLSARETHRVGQAVAVSVEVKNVSEKPLQIVGVLEGSEMGVRFPHYIPEIKAPVELDIEMEAYGNVAPLRVVDFRVLAPQESFNPTEPIGEAAYLPLFLFRNFRPPAPGAYELSLTLSTESERDDQWIGWRDYPGEEKALELLKEVPRFTAKSNVLIVNVEA